MVTRSQVEEVFDTWRHSARRFSGLEAQAERRRSKSDSGLGDAGGGSSHSSPIRLNQPKVYWSKYRPKNHGQKVSHFVYAFFSKFKIQILAPKKKKQRRQKRIRARDMQGEEINVHLLLEPEEKLKLPRLFPSKHPVTYTTRPTIGSPTNDRRRFVNVVRPMTVFPNPPPPPNFTLLSQHKLNESLTSSQFPGRGRPPSPAPFRPTNPRHPPPVRPANFTVAGQSVNGASTQRENGANATGGGTGSALRVNLAGGSGWDLTAIRKGYQGNQKPGQQYARPV